MGYSAPEGNDFAVGNSGGAPPAGNNNGERHGLHADPHLWFENHRDEVEESVRSTVRSLVENSNISWRDRSKVELATEIAIQSEQIKNGDRYIADKGVIVEEVRQSGVTVEKENPALRAKSRLFRDNLKAMKDLGLLEMP